MEKLVCDENHVHTDRVLAAKAHMLSDREAESLCAIFKILGDPTRIRLVWAIKDCELCVCDLAAVLGMTKSAISHQLKTMKELHIVKSRREGKNIFYSLDDQHVTDMLSIAQIHIGHTHE